MLDEGLWQKPAAVFRRLCAQHLCGFQRRLSTGFRSSKSLALLLVFVFVQSQVPSKSVGTAHSNQAHIKGLMCKIWLDLVFYIYIYIFIYIFIKA